MFRPAFGRVFATTWLALLGAGCVGVDPQPLFDTLRVDVAGRSGIEASWPRDAAAEADALRQVQVLLEGTLDADKAARIAILRNRELLAGLEELGIGQAELAQATRLHNPSLELSRQTGGGEGAKVETAIAFDLLDALLLPQRRKLGELELLAVRLSVARLLQQTVADTRIAYFELLTQENKVAALVQVRDLTAAGADMARRQNEAGNLNDRDLAKHELHANLAQVELTQTRLEARAAREVLQRQMGLSGPDLAWKLSLEWPAGAVPEIGGEELETLAVKQRYDLEAARAAVDLVGKALALKKGTRYLPLGIEVGVSRENEGDGARLTGPTLVLELPIFDTGKASIARLEAEQRRLTRQLEGLELEVRSEVRETWDAVRAARQLADFHRRVILPQHAFVVDQTLRHYNMMLEGIYELIEERKEEIEAGLLAVEAERDFWIARTRLDLAVGGSMPAAPASGAPK